jgi:hypothetical protein
MVFQFSTSFSKKRKMNHECSCTRQPSSSSFIIGLVIGGIIAAAIAIVIYRQKDTKVMTNFKKKLFKYLNSYKPDPVKPIIKKTVILSPPKKFYKKKR